jgi:hypothetical protein
MPSGTGSAIVDLLARIAMRSTMAVVGYVCG